MTLIRSRSLALLAFPILAAPCAAQEHDMSPAKELKKYECMLGTWEGSGTVVMAAGGQAIPWTIRTTAQWALNGHFLHDHSVVTFEGGGAPPMEMDGYYGFDREKQRYVSIGASSMGKADLNTIHWTGDTEFVTVSSGWMQGKPFADRSIFRFAKDSYQFVMHRTEGTSEPYVHVKGTMKRVTTDAAAAVAREASVVEGAAPEIAKLQPLLGTWIVKGSMIPAPGAPKMPIAGVENNRLGFGGQILVSHVDGDPAPGMPPYEMVSFIGWDPSENAYDNVFVDNMGMLGKTAMWWVGTSLVSAAAGPYMRQPAARRMVVEFGDAGPTKVTSERLHGTGPAVRDFEATYTRAK